MAVAAALSLVSSPAAADGSPGSSLAGTGGSPSRAEYVERVEPICARASGMNDRILEGARGRVKGGELLAAGHQFVRASVAFEKAVKRIAAVPMPTADEPRLRRWIGHLERVGQGLRKIGAALEADNEVRANHSAIRAERAGNSANNVVFDFDFDHCRFRSARAI